MQFRLIFPGPHGPTVTSDNPKLDAYRQMAHATRVLGRNYRLTAHEDGCYTVAVDGCEPITFTTEDPCPTLPQQS